MNSILLFRFSGFPGPSAQSGCGRQSLQELLRATRTDSQDASFPASGWGAQLDRCSRGTRVYPSLPPWGVAVAPGLEDAGAAWATSHSSPNHQGRLSEGATRKAASGTAGSSHSSALTGLCLCSPAMCWCHDYAPRGSRCPRLTVVTTANVSELVLIGQSGSHAHPSANPCGQDYAD